MSDTQFGRRSTDNLEYMRQLERHAGKIETENAVLRCSVRDLLMDKANLGFKISALNKTIERLRQAANLTEADMDTYQHDKAG